jgi:hypothetical protein
MKGVYYTIRIMNIILLLLLGSNSQIFSQSQKPEELWIHFDRSFYLCGETIWYKIYNIDYHSHTDHSKIVYLNFHDQKGELLQQQVHALKDGYCDGQFKIPVNWSEDYYFATCFTKWNLQFENSGIYTRIVPIYDAFTKQDTLKYKTGDTLDINDKNPLPANIQISIAKKSYSRREKVTFSVSSNLEGHCSAVIKHRDLNKHIKQNDDIQDKLNYTPYTIEYKEREITVQGSVYDPKTNAPIESDVMALYQAGTNNFIRLSAKEGRISTDLIPFEGEAVFQLFNMNPFQSDVVRFEQLIPGNQLNGTPMDIEKPSHFSELSEYIRNARLRKNINEIFDAKTLDSLESYSFAPIAFKSDKVYDMSNFQALDNLEEFLKEIVIWTEFSKQNDGITLRLKNSETQRFFMEKPWYLVDGFLTRDEAEVLKIPFKNLRRVEIFNTNRSILNQLDPVMIRAGMIAVYTDNHLFGEELSQSNAITLKGYSKKISFEGSKIAPPAIARENPDFSSVLYWNPDISLTSEVNLEFITSDLMGEYVIEVQGFSFTGEKIFGTETFEVIY